MDIRCESQKGQLLREIFSVGHFGLSHAKFCRHFKGQISATGPAVRE
jgi:hypothetical protein